MLNPNPVAWLWDGVRRYATRTVMHGDAHRNRNGRVEQPEEKEDHAEQPVVGPESTNPESHEHWKGDGVCATLR